MAEQIKPEYKKEIIHAVEYHFPHAKIILFGSRARGTAQSGADVDIAIDTGAAIHPRELVRMKATFENLNTPLMVDIVDLHSITPELKQLILKEGIVWKK